MILRLYLRVLNVKIDYEYRPISRHEVGTESLLV